MSLSSRGREYYLEIKVNRYSLTFHVAAAATLQSLISPIPQKATLDFPFSSKSLHGTLSPRLSISLTGASKAPAPLTLFLLSLLSSTLISSTLLLLYTPWSVSVESSIPKTGISLAQQSPTALMRLLSRSEPYSDALPSRLSSKVARVSQKVVALASLLWWQGFASSSQSSLLPYLLLSHPGLRDVHSSWLAA